MRRSSLLFIAPLLVGFSAVAASSQTSAKPPTAKTLRRPETFSAAIQRLRDTWVREFNAGHADKVAALYAPDAVLMRRNGSVHTRDSILAELQRSITNEAHDYTLVSLHAEASGDLGYDTGAYNEDLRTHEAEGNYLLVLKRINGQWMIVAHAAVPNPRQR